MGMLSLGVLGRYSSASKAGEGLGTGQEEAGAAEPQRGPCPEARCPLVVAEVREIQHLQ